MAQWFVQRSGDVIGPLSPAELLTLVRSGVVKPATMIRKDDMAWLQASEVGGLFEAAMRPTILSYCPRCDSLLETVPCECPKCRSQVQQPRTRIIENTINDDASCDSPESNDA